VVSVADPYGRILGFQDRVCMHDCMSYMRVEKAKKANPRSRSRRPVRLRDVDTSTFYRQ
jgi:hypothetical protein